jgi:hypothetical protein
MSVLEIPTPWQIIEDARGFQHIHHPNEDDGETQGDLVATVFQDERHARLIAAAPELLEALVATLRASGPQDSMKLGYVYIGEAQELASAAIAKATGEA